MPLRQKGIIFCYYFINSNYNMKGRAMYTNKVSLGIIISLFLLLAVTIFANADVTLNIGDDAPDIILNDQDGQLWKLNDYLGKKNIVVYFYPAAMTGGCTKQACSYRDAKDDLEGLDIVVIGISGDAVKNLKVFQQAHQLNFSLLSDVGGETAKKFGVPLGKGGRISRKIDDEEISLETSYSISRWTFIIDKNGKIVYKNTEVNAAEDSNNILDFLKSYKH
jgi:peroxiredoxin Q/BCP